MRSLSKDEGGENVGMQWDNGMVLLWYIVVPLPAALCNPWVEKNTDNTF